MVLHIMSELPDDAPTPFVRPGLMSWTVAPQVPVRQEPASTDNPASEPDSSSSHPSAE